MAEAAVKIDTPTFFNIDAFPRPSDPLIITKIISALIRTKDIKYFNSLSFL